MADMLKIRLQRVGRKHEPSFRLVLTDSKNSTKSGKYLETLGNYDSRRGDQAVFNAERITHWMSKGAGVSDTVHNLLISKKIITGKKINNLPKKTVPAKEVAPEAAPVAAATPAAAPAEEPVETAAEPASAEATQ